MKIAVYNLKGERVEDMEVSENVFGVPSNNSLLHQVYVAISSNKRVAVAHTKDRSEVAGSGRKPWKQKGTGRARTGSVKNPIWRKGGTIFGPSKDRNFKKKINKKAKHKAIKIALSEKVRNNKFIVVDNFEIEEKKTKSVAKMLSNLKMNGTILLNLTDKEKDLYLYARNITKLTCLPISILNVFDILNNKNLVLSKDAVAYLEKKYNNK